MDVTFPDQETYQVLYAKYLDASLHTGCARLLAYAEGLLPNGLKGARILDIGGGSGRLSKAAAALGARPHLLEPAVQMVDTSADLSLIPRSLQDWAYGAWIGEFDAVLSQQAVNYWLSESCNELYIIANVLKPDGVLIFNTFNTKPPTIPKVSEYVYDNRKYVEVVWMAQPPMVDHLQVCQGYPPHHTQFRWLEPDWLMRSLAKFFAVERYRLGKTDVYCCRWMPPI